MDLWNVETTMWCNVTSQSYFHCLTTWQWWWLHKHLLFFTLYFKLLPSVNWQYWHGARNCIQPVKQVIQPVKQAIQPVKQTPNLSEATNKPKTHLETHTYNRFNDHFQVKLGLPAATCNFFLHLFCISRNKPKPSLFHRKLKKTSQNTPGQNVSACTGFWLMKHKPVDGALLLPVVVIFNVVF